MHGRSRTQRRTPHDPSHPGERRQNSAYFKAAEEYHLCLGGAPLKPRANHQHGADSAQAGEPGTYVEMASGVLNFTSEGKLDTETTSASAFNFNKGAFPNQNIEFDFGDSITTDKGKGTDGTTQYSSKSELYREFQDGYSAGTLTTLSFETDGFLTGMYSNGRDILLGQVSLAKFDNMEALNKAGNNLLRESIDSGTPIIGVGSTGGRGKIFSKNIEASTSDIAKEFVSMMTTQKAFQASAKTISMADDLLTEVINLKR